MIFIFAAVLFSSVAFFFPVSPVSDFAGYWEAAHDLSQYTKGGALLLIYGPLAILNLSPSIAALIVNLSAFLLLASTFPKGKLSSFILLLIGIAWSAWSPIVNSDLPSVALVTVGVNLLIKDKPIPGVVFLAFGLSMRMQVVLLAFFILACLLIMSLRFKLSKHLLTVLTLSILVAVGVDSGFKALSTQSVQIAMSQRVPLYAGFLAAEPGAKCGETAPHSREVMLAEIQQPILEILRVPPEVFRLVVCKWSKMVLYGASGSLWLTYNRLQPTMFLLEATAIHLLKIILVILLIIYRRFNPLYLTSVLLIAGSFAIHAFFEIQPRYMMPSMVISLMLLLMAEPAAQNE